MHGRNGKATRDRPARGDLKRSRRLVRSLDRVEHEMLESALPRNRHGGVANLPVRDTSEPGGAGRMAESRRRDIVGQVSDGIQRNPDYHVVQLVLKRRTLRAMATDAVRGFGR